MMLNDCTVLSERLKIKRIKKSMSGFLLKLGLVSLLFCANANASNIPDNVSAILDETVNNQKAVAANIATEDNGIIVLHVKKDPSSNLAEKNPQAEKKFFSKKEKKKSISDIHYDVSEQGTVKNLPKL
ncbi:MAG: hypothetical protein P4M14_03565 [Gammaproteobacteria bacterium]|nr:hypothetical protein [Gammaproteobacteria bacterium]